MRDPNLLGLNPWELDGYTPVELESLLAYADAKRKKLGDG